MPCESGLPRDHYEKELRVELDKVTRCLCFVMKHLDKYNPALVKHFRCNKELDEWWAEHEEEDRRRARVEASERLRKKERDTALAKLSPKERKLLGLS